MSQLKEIPKFSPVWGEDLIDREEIIRYILSYFRRQVSSVGDQFVILAPRRLGKTSVMKEIHRQLFEYPSEERSIPIWIDMAELINRGGVEEFPYNYLKAFCAGYLNYELRPEKSFVWHDSEFTLDEICKLADKINDPELKRYARGIDMQYKRGEYIAACSSAIYIPRSVGESQKKKFVLFVDELQEVSIINETKGTFLPNPYRSSFETDCVLYLFSGSQVRIISQMMFGPNAALYGRVSKKRIGPLSPDYAVELVDRLLRKKKVEWEKGAKDLLVEYTDGHPFYTTIVANRLKDMTVTKITTEMVEEIFMEELLSGDIHGELLDRTTEHLKKINALELSPQILFRIVHDDPAELKSLHQIEKGAAEVIEKLWMADIIETTFHEAWVKDPVYKQWLKSVYLPLFHFKYPEDKVRGDLLGTIRRLSNDLGRFFELRVRDVIWFFRGKKVDGRFFGHPGRQIQLPSSIEAVQIRKRFGPEENEELYELDLVITYKRDFEWYAWAVECKYQEERRVADDVLEGLLKKAKAFGEVYTRVVDGYWLCTKYPLPQEIQKKAKEMGIFYSCEKEIDELLMELRGGTL